MIHYIVFVQRAMFLIKSFAFKICSLLVLEKKPRLSPKKDECNHINIHMFIFFKCLFCLVILKLFPLGMCAVYILYHVLPFQWALGMFFKPQITNKCYFYAYIYSYWSLSLLIESKTVLLWESCDRLCLVTSCGQLLACIFSYWPDSDCGRRLAVFPPLLAETKLKVKKKEAQTLGGRSR